MKKFEGFINLLFAWAIAFGATHILHWDMLYVIPVFLIVYPWKYKGNIYSLFGGVNSSGSVYSLLGIIQIASKDAKCFFAIMSYQSAGVDSEIVVGFAVFQYAKNDVVAWLGISLVQIAENNVFFIAGLNLVQISLVDDISSFMVISIYQAADDRIIHSIGFSVYQHACHIENWAGIFLFQTALVSTFAWFNISIYQQAKYGRVQCFICIALVQRALDKIACLIYLSLFQRSGERMYVGIGLSFKKSRELTRDSQMALLNLM